MRISTLADVRKAFATGSRSTQTRNWGFPPEDYMNFSNRVQDSINTLRKNIREADDIKVAMAYSLEFIGGESEATYSFDNIDLTEAEKEGLIEEVLERAYQKVGNTVYDTLNLLYEKGLNVKEKKNLRTFGHIAGRSRRLLRKGTGEEIRPGPLAAIMNNVLPIYIQQVQGKMHSRMRPIKTGKGHNIADNDFGNMTFRNRTGAFAEGARISSVSYHSGVLKVQASYLANPYDRLFGQPGRFEKYATPDRVVRVAINTMIKDFVHVKSLQEYSPYLHIQLRGGI